MTTMTREDAIKEFGRHFNVSSFVHALNIDKVSLNSASPEFTRRAPGQFEEELGSISDLAIEFKPELYNTISHLNNGHDFLDQESLTRLLKAVATHAFDTKKELEIARLEELTSKKEPTGWISQLLQNAASVLDVKENEEWKSLTGKEVYEGLKVKITHLPDTIVFKPKKIMSLGDEFYRVNADYIQERGTSISTFTVTNRRVNKVAYGSEEGKSKYDIFYTAYCGNTKVHFDVNDQGKIWNVRSGDCTSLWGAYFLTLKGAQNHEAKIWSQVESNRQKYLRNRPKVLAP